ncbi:MAG: hypothetical protein GF317_02975 [Candidatus Lokiarchaeota archaeon]|nr:hypothetical protein [Candidatus Lokiarchaeota archaeon]MBD3198869.1 hypothetical protein [Candidatus Lokiarchaeota archaeon]
MKYQKKVIFLFMEHIPPERLEWLSKCFNTNETEIANHKKLLKNQKNNGKLRFFLTGDALFSLIDKRHRKNWDKLIKLNNFQCHLDSEEIKLLGLEIDKLNKLYNKENLSGSQTLPNRILKNNSRFWDNVIKSVNNQSYGDNLGFLEFQGPYMSRTSIYALQLLEKIIESKLNPELYTYLDGIHIGHLGQKPSEFENVEKKLLDLRKKANLNNLHFKMLSCSRCGTARGYIRDENDKEYFQSEDTLQNYLFCNLNKIINRFEENNIILTPSCGSIQYLNGFNENVLDKKKELNSKHPIIIFITHSPYGSEWTFGGLSFAMACANHEIPTKVIFIEDGTYCLPTIHKINEQDKIFNIQDIILATSDMEFLQYYVLDDSLKKRDFHLVNKLNNSIEKIDNIELGRIILSRQYKSITHKRIIFY